jgi:hypothetical protein
VPELSIDSPRTTQVNETRFRFWPLFAVVPFAVLAASHWTDPPSLIASDYAQYLLHAKAIVEGRPYGDVGYIFTEHNPFVGPQVQPPGWPLLLAPSVALFGTALLVPKILVTLAACAFIWAAAVRISRDDTRMVALLSAAICGVALESDFAINSALSDLPFAAALWGVILALDSDTPLSGRRAVGIWVAGVFVMSIRVLGVALIPGVLLLALLRRRDRALLLAIASGWIMLGLAVLLVVGAGNIPFLGFVLRAPLKMLPQLSDVEHYRYPVFEALLYPTPWDRVNDIYHLIVPIFVIPGLVEAVRRFGRSGAGAIAVGIIIVLFASPVADARYLWPLWPVLAYSIVAGARFWIQRFRIAPARQPRVLLVGIGLLIASSVLTSLNKPSPPSFVGTPGTLAVVEWVKNESRNAPLRVAFFSPRVLTLETGVPAMPWLTRSPETTIGELRLGRITHVIIGDFGIAERSQKAMEETVRSQPTNFQLVHRGENFSIYRFIASPPDSAQIESRGHSQ